jgi:aryl-alcohol dehydrogenase
VARNALACVRLGGAAALVGAQVDDLVLDTLAVVGKTAIWVLEGSADPKTFIPRMIELWQAGQFPFDRLIEQFPLAEIDAAEEASLSGRVIKPVLRP